MTVQRYYPVHIEDHLGDHAAMEGHPNGGYVLCSDYTKLEALLNRVMWQDYGDPDNHDPVNDRCALCGAQRRSGHKTGCEATTLLNTEALEDR